MNQTELIQNIFKKKSNVSKIEFIHVKDFGQHCKDNKKESQHLKRKMKETNPGINKKNNGRKTLESLF